MLVSFSVSNFRSFSTEESFSMVASSRLAGAHEDHAIAIPDSTEKVLKTAAIYGANGAGKSNLFKALQYLKSVALEPRPKNGGTRRDAFRFGGEPTDPSCFDLQFIAADKLYRFGCKLNDQRIVEEWLVRVEGGREKPLYERITSEDGNVEVEAPSWKGKKLRALIIIGGAQNQSFLATILATLEKSDLDEELRAIVAWFQDGLNLVGPDDRFAFLGAKLAKESELLEFAGDFLKMSSTGVDRLSVQKSEITEDELRNFLPVSMAAQIMDKLRDEGAAGLLMPLGSGNDLLIERTDKDHFCRITIHAEHQQQSGDTIALDLGEESDGTRRLLDLIPALHDLRSNNAIYFIDEIDRSLHPMLVRKFLESFLNSCDGGQRQIIVTTHESSLLDLDLLRRDEIWFAEKDAASATRLYSLADFNVRKDLEIRKHYLQGRFGAVPFLGNIDQLMTAEQGLK
jgi:energy-coupling factor transporter ATP-binding protein EcfA2